MGVTADGYPWIEDPDQPADMLAWTAEAAGAAQTVLDTHEMAPDPHGVYLRKAGGTMTGPLVLPGNATAALQAVPKQQLDLKADLGEVLRGLGGMRARIWTVVVTGNVNGNATVTFGITFTAAPLVLVSWGDDSGVVQSYRPLHTREITTTSVVVGGLAAGGQGRITVLAIGTI